MPGLVTGDAMATPHAPGFSVYSQKVELDINFATRSAFGRTELTILPHSRDLRHIRLNSRQCTRITRMSVEGKPINVLEFEDVYAKLNVFSKETTVHQHHLLRKRIQPQIEEQPEEELVIAIPKSVHIREFDPFSAAGQGILLDKIGGAALAAAKQDGSDAPVSALETSGIRTAGEQGQWAPIKVLMEYYVEEFRDGLQFVGLAEDDLRYPHVYTRNSPFPGAACCLFPCVDNPNSRCLWEISIRCPRTLGDAMRPLGKYTATKETAGINGAKGSSGVNGVHPEEDDGTGLSPEEKGLDMAVVCSGEMTDEIIDKADQTRKVVTFSCQTPVAPHHVGFAVGPFEHVNLSDFRESDEDEKLGQNAIRVHGFCLPGRATEVENTCMTLARTIDYFSVNYGSYPFTSYKLCFVDELVEDVLHTSSFSICSTRLLFPPNILDPIDEVTRTVTHAVASQWIGVNIIPKDLSDSWVIFGGSYFMTDMFLLTLCGKNDHRFRYKMMADSVVQSDVHRPSLTDLGRCLSIDPSESEFMALKSALVLFILHQRMIKASGRNGVNRVLWRVLLNSKVGNLQNGEISTSDFMRVCEKVGHMALHTFFGQWVHGAGCPQFVVTQRFNKKKLVVEMNIRQVQNERTEPPPLESRTFMRDWKEDNHKVYAGTIQPVFTGPMTIRIHEADGTPYEHIVDIKEMVTKFEIPYNTKYKRLKRSRRQKERAAAAAGLDISGDTQDDVLLYCLGDVLQSEEEVNDWKLEDWSKEDEERMSQESYEWIRMDADFEWICKMTLGMPHYMFVSQLQQDKDVVAQVESLQYLEGQNPHPLISSILTRTLMDGRYFHGIRTKAASVLARCARDELNWIGLDHLEKAFQELFCFPNSPMTRSNDFSDRSLYVIQCAIPRAISKVRDNGGRAPARVKQFFIDKLKFNDNSNNEFSDEHYVATLMSCMAETLSSLPPPPNDFDFEDAEGDIDEDFDFAYEHEIRAKENELQSKAIAEIERYRRIDEWIPSFHNVYSTTALDCLRLLTQKGVIPRKIADFLQYTRPGNSEFVRLRAFQCLADIGAMRSLSLLRYLLYSYEMEESPYMRDRMFRLLGYILGKVAIGQDIQEKTSNTSTEGGLVVEDADATTALRQANKERTHTVEGAVRALREELGQIPALKEALLKALTSPLLGLYEFAGILDICDVLYEKETRLVVVLDLPHYWACRHLGNAHMHFYQTDKVRTKPRLKLVSPPAPHTDAAAMPPPASRPQKDAAGQPQRRSSHILKINTKAFQQAGKSSAAPLVFAATVDGQTRPAVSQDDYSHPPSNNGITGNNSLKQLRSPTSTPTPQHVTAASAPSVSPAVGPPSLLGSATPLTVPKPPRKAKAPRKSKIVTFKLPSDRLSQFSPENADGLAGRPQPPAAQAIPKLASPGLGTPPIEQQQPLSIGPTGSGRGRGRGHGSASAGAGRASASKSSRGSSTRGSRSPAAGRKGANAGVGSGPNAHDGSAGAEMPYGQQQITGQTQEVAGGESATPATPATKQAPFKLKLKMPNQRGGRT
ncbi:hypothetical protein BDY21DRAFT_358347 [Lineolata rhizophorae]|uniref:Transcription initiation factor TFIID subunit 2 n=1 Tax=Lineolata rhizophorae TaxID=578093 RepID=A0A6A6NLQ9_9PEZI|nr:hypothetical protein BDY21DRAFT_358347 [Lineolata rhizophorae]